LRGNPVAPFCLSVRKLPRDLLDQVTALCRYRGIEPVLSREMLDLACEAYFLDDKVSQPPTAPVRPRRKRRADVEVR